MSIVQAAKYLSILKSSLGKWVVSAREGKLVEIGTGQRIPSNLEMELARTREELAERRWSAIF